MPAGGATARYFFGDDTLLLGEFAWYRGIFDDTIHGVAEKKPNRLGPYDLYGSMLEMTEDRYDSAYYENSPLFDPAGPRTYPANELSHDPFRAVRDGFFHSPAKDVTSSRLPNFSSARHPQAFRCVRKAME